MHHESQHQRGHRESTTGRHFRDTEPTESVDVSSQKGIEDPISHSRWAVNTVSRSRCGEPRWRNASGKDWETQASKLNRVQNRMGGVVRRWLHRCVGGNGVGLLQGERIASDWVSEAERFMCALVLSVGWWEEVEKPT